MRILTGRWRGRPIPFRPSPAMRPTPDKVRIAMIQTLADALPGARVLDLCAGTGALGLEALSAGAAEAVFVESNGPQCARIRAAADALGAGTSASVRRSEALRALQQFRAAGERFDLVFADPPYETGLARAILGELAAGQALKAGGWAVIETYKSETLPDRDGPLVRRRRAAYGDTALHYYLFDNEAGHPI